MNTYCCTIRQPQRMKGFQMPSKGPGWDSLTVTLLEPQGVSACSGTEPVVVEQLLCKEMNLWTWECFRVAIS